MRVSDVGEQSIEVEVEVEVHSVHKSPEILNLPRRLAVSEDASPGKLFTVRTVGEDPADVVEVYFTVLQGDPELFELQGALRLLHTSVLIAHPLTPYTPRQIEAQGGIPQKQKCVSKVHILFKQRIVHLRM